jgi:hypothetical protein
MRSSDFIDETVFDILHQHIAEVVSNDEAKALFEEASDAELIVEFFANADVVGELSNNDIGKTFFPFAIIVLPLQKFMSIAKFSQDATLVEVSQTGQYVFKVGNVKQTFPPINENALHYRLIFSSKKVADQFELMLKMKFGTWRILSKLL